jgi:anti-sigma regulatory factor (Ser/Thr protein kinase)
VCDCGRFPGSPRSSKRRKEGGRGIPLITAVMDNFEVVPGSGTTSVRFQKRLAFA